MLFNIIQKADWILILVQKHYISESRFSQFCSRVSRPNLANFKRTNVITKTNLVVNVKFSIFFVIKSSKIEHPSDLKFMRHKNICHWNLLDIPSELRIGFCGKSIPLESTSLHFHSRSNRAYVSYRVNITHSWKFHR